jgi:EF hand
MTCTDSVRHAIGALLLAAAVSAAAADAKAEYERRSAERYVSLFLSLDRNKDGAVTRSEAQGDLNFIPRFDDMDINRDGAVTAAELQGFVEQQHGIRVSVGAR